MTSQKVLLDSNLPPKTMNIVYTSKSFNADYIKICQVQTYLSQSHIRKDKSSYEFVEQGIVGNLKVQAPRSFGTFGELRGILVGDLQSRGKSVKQKIATESPFKNFGVADCQNNFGRFENNDKVIEVMVDIFENDSYNIEVIVKDIPILAQTDAFLKLTTINLLSDSLKPRKGSDKIVVDEAGKKKADERMRELNEQSLKAKEAFSSYIESRKKRSESLYLTTVNSRKDSGVMLTNDSKRDLGLAFKNV